MLLLVCVSSCSYFSKHREILDCAERMIESNHADSAYELLKPIHLENVKGAKQQARFALLYSQALDKNYIDVKDDSLALIAVDYYATKGTAKQKTKAYYYLGRVYENAGCTEECIINLTSASECVPEEDYYLIGLIYSHLGELYYEQLKYEKAIDMYDISIDAFTQSKSVANEAIIAYKISTNYRLLKQYNEAEKYIYRALNITLSNKDYQSVLIYLKSVEILEIEQGKPLEAVLIQLHENYNKYNNGVVPPSDYYYLSDLYCEVNNTDSALLYLNKYKQRAKALTTEDRLAITVRLHKIAEKQNNYKQANDYAQIEMLYADTINIIREQYLIEKVTEKYKSQLFKSQFINEKSKSKIMRYLILLLFVGSSSITYVIYTRYKNRVAKMNEDKALANDLIDSLTTSQSILTQQYEAIKSSNNSKDAETIVAVMEQFNNLIEKVPECEKRPRKFIDEFISLVRSSKLSDSNTFIYDTVNKQYDGAVDYLKVKHDLSQSEAETLCMISMGFSNSAMTIAFNHTTSKTVYNYKSSLKSKLNIVITQNSVMQYLKSI